MATTMTLAEALLMALAMQLLPLLLARHPSRLMFTPLHPHSYGNAYPTTIGSYGLVDSRPISVDSFDASTFLPHDASRQPRHDSSPAADYSPPALIDAPPSHGQSTRFPAVESLPADLYNGHRPAYAPPRTFGTSTQSLVGKSPDLDETNPHDTSAERLISSRNSYGSYREGTVSAEDVPISTNSNTPSHNWPSFDSSRPYGRDVLPYGHDLATAGNGN